MGGYREVIMETAFERSLKENRNIYAYYNHDDNKILGSTKSETLVLESRGEGLFCKLFLGNTSFANDCWDIISRGDCNTLSFAFIPHEVENRGNLRYLKSVNLKEISFCVSKPAYEETNSVAYTRKRTIYIGGKNMKEKLVTRSLNFELLQQLMDSGGKIDDEETAKELISLIDPKILKQLTAADDPDGGGTVRESGNEEAEKEKEKEAEAEKQEVLDEIEKELQKKDEPEPEPEPETEKEKEE
jgi:HK97 family phage prohead protease